MKLQDERPVEGDEGEGGYVLTWLSSRDAREGYPRDPKGNYELPARSLAFASSLAVFFIEFISNFYHWGPHGASWGPGPQVNSPLPFYKAFKGKN